MRGSKIEDSSSHNPISMLSSMSNEMAKEVYIKLLESKINAMKNTFEIGEIRLRNQITVLEEKSMNNISELENTHSTVKYLYDINKKFEDEIETLKEKLKKLTNEKEEQATELFEQLEDNQRDVETREEEYRAEISDLTYELANHKIELNNVQSSVSHYKQTLADKAETIEQLKKDIIGLDDKISRFRASRVVMAHHNYSIEEDRELKLLNQLLKEQLEKNKELTESNRRHTLEIRNYGKQEDDSKFWKFECEKLQNKLIPMRSLEKKLIDTKLELNILNAIVTEWKLYELKMDKSPSQVISSRKKLEIECVVLNDELCEYKLNISKLNVENRKLAHSLDELVKEKEEENDKQTHSDELCETYKQQNILLKTEVRISKYQMREIFELLKNANRDNPESELAKNYSKVEDAINESQMLIDKYKSSIEQLTNTLNSHEYSQVLNNKKRKLEEPDVTAPANSTFENSKNEEATMLELQEANATIKSLNEKLKRLEDLSQDREDLLSKSLELEQDVSDKKIDTNSGTQYQSQIRLLKGINENLIKQLQRDNDSKVTGHQNMLPISVYEGLKAEIKLLENKLNLLNSTPTTLASIE